MRFRYIIRLVLLAVAFALTTYGLLAWQQSGFNLDAMWPLADVMGPHPVYSIVIGLGLIPPTLWEIFLLANSPNQTTTSHADEHASNDVE